MHKQKRFIAIAAAVGVFSIFLPWIKVPFAGGINATESIDVWFGTGMYAIVILLMYFSGNSSHALNNVTKKLEVAVAATMAIVVGILFFIGYKHKMAGVADGKGLTSFFGSSVSLGSGMFLFIGAGLFILVFCFFWKQIDKEVGAHN